MAASGSPSSSGGVPETDADGGNATGTLSPGTSGGTTDAGHGSGTPPALDASNGSSGGPGPAPATVTFSQVYSTILAPTCSSCHGNDAPMMSFASKATAYADLVGVKSQGSGCKNSGETRVVAGSSATSLLSMKVAGTETCGVRMPKARTPLTATNIALIRSWIDQGAMND